MTFILIAVVLVDFAFSVAAYRRQRREHREFMAEMHRKWRELQAARAAALPETK